MNKGQKKSGIWESFGQAFHGIFHTWRTQGHFRFHLFAALVVVICGLLFKVSPLQWLFLVIAIGSVIAAEVFNTAIEIVVDLAHPDFHPMAGLAKDVAAGAVVIAAIQAVVIGVVIFWMPFIRVIKSIFS